MHICLECDKMFESPKYYVETHGLATLPYEVYAGCPYCGGSFTTAHECASCGEYIEDEYVKIGDQRYCSECYTKYELGEEDGR